MRWIESVLAFVLEYSFNFQSKMNLLIRLFFEFIGQFEDLKVLFFKMIVMRIGFVLVRFLFRNFFLRVVFNLTFPFIFGRYLNLMEFCLLKVVWFLFYLLKSQNNYCHILQLFNLKLIYQQELHF